MEMMRLSFWIFLLLGLFQAPVVRGEAVLADAEPPAGPPASQREEAEEESVREWLLAHPEEMIYTVVLGVTMHGDGRLLHLRVSRVSDPRSKHNQPIEIEVPPEFMHAARRHITQGPFQPTSEAGMPGEFYTYVFYLPAFPKAVVAKIDQPMIEVREQALLGPLPEAAPAAEAVNPVVEKKEPLAPPELELRHPGQHPGNR